MKIVFSDRSWAEYLWMQKHDPELLDRLHRLMEECRRHPFTGTGKPEALRQNLSGWWSRRISGEHRLVYRITGKDEAQALEIAQCRYHY